MRRQDDELARVASNALVHRPGDGQDAFAVLHAAFAQDVDEGAGGAGVGLLNRLVFSLAATSFRATRSSRKPTQEAYWSPFEHARTRAPNSSALTTSGRQSSSGSRTSRAGRPRGSGPLMDRREVAAWAISAGSPPPSMRLGAPPIRWMPSSCSVIPGLSVAAGQRPASLASSIGSG